MFFQWSQSATPRALHHCMTIGVACCMSGHCSCLTLHETQLWKLYSETLRCYLSLFCWHAVPNPTLFACCLAFPSSSPPKSHLDISSNTCLPTVAKSIPYYQNFPPAASALKFSKNQQPLYPCAGVHLSAVSSGSVLRWWTDGSSAETQPPYFLSLVELTQVGLPHPFVELLQG